MATLFDGVRPPMAGPLVFRPLFDGEQPSLAATHMASNPLPRDRFFAEFVKFTKFADAILRDGRHSSESVFALSFLENVAIF